MDPADAIAAENLDGVLDPPGDAVSRFDFVVFDVDHAQTEADRWLEIVKDIQFVIASSREFQQQVIAFQGIEKRQKIAEEALLNRLTAVVAKAQVNAFFMAGAAEDAVDAGGGNFSVLRRTG